MKNIIVLSILIALCGCNTSSITVSKTPVAPYIMSLLPPGASNTSDLGNGWVLYHLGYVQGDDSYTGNFVGKIQDGHLINVHPIR